MDIGRRQFYQKHRNGKLKFNLYHTYFGKVNEIACQSHIYYSDEYNNIQYPYESYLMIAFDDCDMGYSGFNFEYEKIPKTIKKDIIFVHNIKNRIFYKNLINFVGDTIDHCGCKFKLSNVLTYTNKYHYLNDDYIYRGYFYLGKY